MDNTPEVYVKYKEGYGKIKICARSAFSVWLRYPPWNAKLEGFTNNDIDIVIRNYKTNQWFLIEEKTNGVTPEWYQLETFKTIHKSITDPNYMGYHLILFSNTTPDNSHTIMLNNVVITRDDLIEFLRFKKAHNWYETTMFNTPNKSIETEAQTIEELRLKDRQAVIDAHKAKVEAQQVATNVANDPEDTRPEHAKKLNFPTLEEWKANRQVYWVNYDRDYYKKLAEATKEQKQWN